MRRLLILAIALTTVGALQPARAATPDTICTVTSGSAATPHLVDPANDWEGAVGGNGTATFPYGDIYGASTDMISGWINRSATGAWTATLETAQWVGVEQNAEVYFWWTYGTGAQSRRFVDVVLARVGANPIYQYNYGYLAVNPQTGLGTVTNAGSTTGSVTPGAPGRFTINIPMNRMGSPQPGEALLDIEIESRVLIGAAQAGGLLGTADTSINADGCVDLAV